MRIASSEPRTYRLRLNDHKSNVVRLRKEELGPGGAGGLRTDPISSGQISKDFTPSRRLTNLNEVTEWQYY